MFHPISMTSGGVSFEACGGGSRVPDLEMCQVILKQRLTRKNKAFQFWSVEPRKCFRGDLQVRCPDLHGRPGIIFSKLAVFGCFWNSHSINFYHMLPLHLARSWQVLGWGWTAVCRLSRLHGTLQRSLRGHELRGWAVGEPQNPLGVWKIMAPVII